MQDLITAFALGFLTFGIILWGLRRLKPPSLNIKVREEMNGGYVIESRFARRADADFDRLWEDFSEYVKEELERRKENERKLRN